MRNSTAVRIAWWVALCSGWPWGALRPQAARTLVLEDFESPDAATKWEGEIRLAQERSSHGRYSARVRFENGRSQVRCTGLLQDWRGYDRLLFDIYCDREGISTATIRIDDNIGGDAGLDDYFEAREKILVQKGWNHVEVKLKPLRAASGERDLSVDRIRRVSIAAGRGPLPWTIYLDNFRLVAAREGRETASRSQPQDMVTIIDNRWFTVRQVARPEDVPESPDVAALRTEAQREFDSLDRTIRAARLQGIETIYEERHLVTAGLGLHVRPRLAWFNNDEKKREMFSYTVESCRRARLELEDKIQGMDRLPEADDTQVRGPLIRPYPPLKGRPIKDGFFLGDDHEPLLILSLHSPSQALLPFFATPFQHIESYTVGGGSRWTIDDSPVYAAFKQWPDARRVGWDGWCGHLVRDLSSMGGRKRENVVICLESPHIRQAVEEYIRINIPKFHANPELLYDIMAYELMYICYCERSQRMFREWLEQKHVTVERANEKWGTAYKSFNEVVPPPVANSRPLPGTNRALWYDWARFNQDRFTGYLLWVRTVIRNLDPATPLAAGGSSSMLAGRTGTTGIDEERIVNEIDDVIIHEGGESTLGLDLQVALSERKKPVADPEMGLAGVEHLLPHFLHGKSVAQLYHWPAQPANEFHSNNASSLAHSWRYPLADIGELLRAALDLRRLNREIAAFSDDSPEVAILYAQTATLQLPPEMLTWQTTPYLTELERTYEASRYLDARVTFATERQILKGWLNRYKLLIVPAVRNIPAEVFEKIRGYAAEGGRVLVVPESFLGNEYNRPADYLSGLGIAIRETRRPKPGASGVMVQGYDQSFSQAVALENDAPEKLLPAATEAFGSMGELEGRGVRQNFEVRSVAGVLFRYPDGGPAVAQVPVGKGAFYYSGSSFEERSYARLLDVLFEKTGVTRPVRLRRTDGRDKWKIEARFARLGNRKLLYVVNFNSAAIRLNVDAAPGFFSSLLDLREQHAIRGAAITVPAHQTSIYEMF